MKKMIALFACTIMIASIGCGNLSPRDNLSPQLDQKIRDIQGQQATLENNQNAIKVEIGRLQNSLNLTNSNGNNVQEGYFNLQADGILVLCFAVSTIAMLLYYMYKSEQYKKSAEIIAEQVNLMGNDILKEQIFASAWNTNVEKTVCNLIG